MDEQQGVPFDFEPDGEPDDTAPAAEADTYEPQDTQDSQDTYDDEVEDEIDADDSALVFEDDSPPEPRKDVEPQEAGLQTTGNPEVDDVLESVGQVSELPTSEHVEVYEDAHRRLHETLVAAVDEREQRDG